jgi:cell wall-associated NlpC family hydrolase
MSIEAVVGRINRILAAEQELAQGVPAVSRQPAGAHPASSSTSFGDVLAGAQATPAASDARVQAMIAKATSLLGRPYILGGGHSGWGSSAGYDCSGFVSAVLHAGGYLTEPVNTEVMPSQPGLLRGPGRYVTVYDRSGPAAGGHVIIEIAGQFYESGGARGAWGGGGGVEKIGRPSDTYLSTFDAVLHPKGL